MRRLSKIRLPTFPARSRRIVVRLLGLGAIVFSASFAASLEPKTLPWFAVESNRLLQFEVGSFVLVLSLISITFVDRVVLSGDSPKSFGRDGAVFPDREAVRDLQTAVTNVRIPVGLIERTMESALVLNADIAQELNRLASEFAAFRGEVDSQISELTTRIDSGPNLASEFAAFRGDIDRQVADLTTRIDSGPKPPVGPFTWPGAPEGPT
jgi:hypothetical protein